MNGVNAPTGAGEGDRLNFLRLISRRRGEIMGVAALMILCLHIRMDTGSRLWRFFITQRGNMGVDMFVFLSGFGLAFSLEKHSDIGPYYARRMRRVLPSYYVSMLLVWLIAGVPPLRKAVQHCLPIGIWVGYWNCWYVSATLVYYLLIPLIFHLVRHARAPRAMAAAWLFLLSLPIFMVTRDAYATIAIGRFPALALGTAAGAFALLHSRRKDRLIDAALLLAVYAAGVVLTRHPMMLSHAPRNLITREQAGYIAKGFRTPLMIVALAAALECVERSPLRFLNAPLRFAGKYSLEMYLGHNAFFYFDDRFLHLPSKPVRLVVTLLVIWPVAWLIYHAGQRGLALLKRLPIMNRPA